ncbi:LysR family transcriptional regulator [Burkholderia sp. Ac-20345]|uniref:LysR family transcriptional regulator n=1 Tax=Burkholderia sp. Ac-20345 TaxID=2703891 RepID=UPI00197C4DCF|nr:LysR family transcriptional regulator [Burkholderia sp. Ac-20345]MBN3781385.1 LysR family transcriptional regulator [Burkholderia sp. Ac-20345]
MQSSLANTQATCDLNDLRLVAAIHETGSLSGAARRLGLNHATVFRRITAVESSLGVRLFDRQRGRYSATAAGEELAMAGAEIDALATKSLQLVAGQDMRPSGIVRIATTESFVDNVLPPILRKCRTAYPDIRFDILSSNMMHDLSRGEADIAIRPAQRAPENLIAKKIGDLVFAVYGSRTYLNESPATDWQTHNWIALEGTQSQHRVLTWMEKLQPPERVAFVFSTFISMCAACARGLGLAVLPCFLADSRPELVKLATLPEDCWSQIWLLVHPDRYRTTRVKAVFALLHEALLEDADLIAGRTKNVEAGPTFSNSMTI